ncbi:hypothetical protein ACFL2J_03500 [Candidatus Omnitrophota bacterium]
MNINNNKGMVMLIVSYAVVVVLLVLGAVFFSRSFGEHVIAQRQRDYVQVIAIAEAGLDRTFYNLKQDFEIDADPSWTDGTIYFEGTNLTWGPHYDDFEVFIDWTSFGEGEYRVEMRNVSGSADALWVRSTARVADTEKTIQSYIKAANFNIWNNAIFAGAGASGAMINGNVDIRGSVHILGNNLGPFDYAFDMSGSAIVGNNYEGISSDLLTRIPSCPTTVFNGETIEFLDATVRVKHGLAGLSGSGVLGGLDSVGDSYKETLEGVYITDGYGGNQGAGNVYSDNGTEHAYDLEDAIEFPSLSDPYGGYDTYMDYLRDNALVISDSAQLNELANIQPDSNFAYTDAGGKGSISMDGNGNLAIDGIVYIDNGGDFNFKWVALSNTINYTGRGSVVATGDVNIKTNLYTSGNNSFPANVMGIMTPNDITFETSQLEAMGAFFAEGVIKCTKQTNVAGAFVSNYFDMGSQVPAIYQIPALADNLPPGMISKESIWIIITVAWQEL